MTNLEQFQAKARKPRAPPSSMDGVLLPSSCDSKRATRKRANGFTMQPLKTTLIAFAELREKPRTRPLEFKLSLNRLLHCTSHPWRAA
jgi:hypothetical protein